MRNSYTTLFEIDRIRQLKSRYFRFLDSKDWDGLATVFSEDAIFDARLATAITAGSSGDQSWYAEGRADIVAFIRRVVERTITVHHGHNHEVELFEPNRARGVVALEDWIWSEPGTDAKLILHGWGHYREEYQLTEDGWQVACSTLTRLNLILS